MDTLITYDEALALVANPPTLAPHPNFTNLRALRRHLQRALQRLVIGDECVHLEVLHTQKGAIKLSFDD